MPVAIHHGVGYNGVGRHMDEEVAGHPDMSPDDWQRFLDHVRTHPFGDQDENGIDLSLLRANLKLTPTQRVEKMREALRSSMAVESDRQARLSKDTR